MDESVIIISLALLTLLIGMAVAAFQLWSVKRSQRKGEHADGRESRPNA